MDKAREKLKAALENSGVTMKEASLALGKSHAYIFGYLTKGSPKKLDGDDRRKLAILLKVSEEELSGDLIPRKNTTKVSDQKSYLIAGIPLLGTVAAGVWREVGADQPEGNVVPVVPDPRFAVEEQFALEVEGTSMNKIFEPGEYAHCVSINALSRDPRDGDLVVVERRRSGLVEATLKRVRNNGQGLELWPESTDPRYQAPIALDSGEAGQEIVVTAFVVGRYARFS